MQKNTSKLYFITFGITILLFIAALVSSDYVSKKRIEHLKTITEKIAIDLLSIETQFDLLKDTSCSSYDKDIIQKQLRTLSSRLAFMEQQLGTDNPEVIRLKHYYYVLEIQDYLLSKKMAEQCKHPAVFILYFYSNKDCDTCLAQEYILRAVRNEYPQVIQYSFEYGAIDLPALQTLISLHNIPQNPPVIDINGTLYSGFNNVTELKAIIDPLIATSSVATSSARTIKKQ